MVMVVLTMMVMVMAIVMVMVMVMAVLRQCTVPPCLLTAIEYIVTPKR